MMARWIFAAIVFVSLASGEWRSAADEQWPGWRGPGRDGWVKDFAPPGRWPAQLHRKWQIPVGTGYASPVVSGGRVFQHARQDEDEVVWCIDLETGKVKWRQSYAAPFKIAGGGEYHGKGPKSSPALADGKLFTLSIAGVLTAWDIESGRVLWRRDYTDRFGAGHPNWGAATSPLVEAGRVIVHFGGDERGALVALDTATGKEVWKRGDAGASYASPIVVELDGVRQIIELNMKGLAAVEARSGQPLWEYPYPQVGTDQNMVTPAFDARRGLVLLGGENRGIRGLEPRRQNGSWTVVERWHQRDVALDMSSAIVHGDMLYGFSHYDKGRIFCLDPESGTIMWTGPPRTGDNVMFLAVPEYVIALVDDGELQIIAATAEAYKKVASYRVADTATWAPPVLLGSHILVKDTETLTLWSLTK